MNILPAAALRQWQAWSTRFQALSRRERLWLALALIGGIGYLGIVLWVEPTWAQARRLEQQASAAAADLAGVQAQIQAVGAQVARDPDLPVRQEQAALSAQLAELDQRLAAFQGTLVAPNEAGALLSDLVRRQPGVRVAGLTTLPATGLLTEMHAAGEANAAAPARALDVYRHGFELKLRGNYLDLLAYLKGLEAEPKQLLWQRAALVVREYPESELTLQVYTLSFAKHWLTL
ncbi:MAG: type II secretion system protein M [Azovibrio sp.]|nr:type II secretion system protein M [Azovibrio sp.]